MTSAEIHLTHTHLFDLPLLWVRNFGEPLSLQGVVLLHLGGVAQVQVARPVRVPHRDLLTSVWAYVSPPVGVQVLSCLLVHILAKGDENVWPFTFIQGGRSTRREHEHQESHRENRKCSF